MEEMKRMVQEHLKAKEPPVVAPVKRAYDDERVMRREGLADQREDWKLREKYQRNTMRGSLLRK